LVIANLEQVTGYS